MINDDIENLKSLPISIIKENNEFNIEDKINFLEGFKTSTLEHLKNLENKAYANISINKFNLYFAWLERQLIVLKNNETYIVD